MQRFCLKSRELFFVQIALFDDCLVDELVEPAGIHHKVALLAALIAPAVLDLPAVRCAVFIEIDPGDHHGVIHGGLAVIQALLLGHGEIDSQCPVKIKYRITPDSHLALAHGAYIGAEPYDLAVLQLLHDQIFELLHREIQIGDRRSAGYIAQIIDRAVLIKRLVLCRGVDDADVVFSQIVAEIFFIECMRSKAAVNMVDLVLIGVLKIKILRRFTEAHGEETICILQITHLDSFCVSAFLHGCPEVHCSLAQQRVDQAVHVSGVAALESLLHGSFRDDTVLLNDIDEHVPLAAVADARIEQENHEPVGERSVRKRDHGFIEEVDLFELVPEGCIVLRELELLKIQVIRDLLAEDVEGCEDPAAAAGFLIGDAHGRDFYGELELGLIEPSVRESNVFDVVFCEGVGHCTVQRRSGGDFPECVNGT